MRSKKVLSQLNHSRPVNSIQKRILPQTEHRISRSDISENALKVLSGLHKAGFDSYLVGGCVRDLLLGREPKDFDVATNALPEEVRRVFKNCRLIGRRFRLAHVYFGREIIEVATYRAPPGKTDSSREDEVHTDSDSGRILRDNVYGTLEEDAIRRDFTVNALYYNFADDSVTDFVGGVQDLNDGLIKIIGDPATRYREDPVRMLRAIRFSAKLGLKIDTESEAPIKSLSGLLLEVPAARKFEEVLKLFHGGAALNTFEALRHADLFRYLFPQTEASLARESQHFPAVLIPTALKNTDSRIEEGKPVTPAFLLAVMLWGSAHDETQRLVAAGMGHQDALRSASSSVLREQAKHTSIPKRFTAMMREIWMLQSRFEPRNGKRAFRLLQHQRFRAAYDFLCLRSESGELDNDLCQWWTLFQEAGTNERKQMVETLPPVPGKKRKRKNRKRNNKNNNDG